ncbi:acyl carrier protein [Paraburkholderia sp. BCC1884]|uniref:acyl carrier protein n=1 Tax=Paraburkholderia sp. BCC1884 TaxID=2562668 RepID=UPI001183FA09|nr:acyl carrier protein [Paraburkholderia sp. BCC1884]
MLQLPITNLPALAGPSTPAAPVDAGNGQAESPVGRLIDSAQRALDRSTQPIVSHLEQLDSRRISTVDMLRLQADMTHFAVRVELTSHLAEQFGSALQTLTQRS